MKFKKMAAVALAGVTACATVPAAVPVFAADGYDHEAIENAGDITITMMVSGIAAFLLQCDKLQRCQLQF